MAAVSPFLVLTGRRQIILLLRLLKIADDRLLLLRLHFLRVDDTGQVHTLVICLAQGHVPGFLFLGEIEIHIVFRVVAKFSLARLDVFLDSVAISFDIVQVLNLNTIIFNRR